MLLGHSNLETGVNGLYDGMAEGYQMTASGHGTLSTLSVYVDTATTATKLFVGLYSDNNGHPGSRLTGGNSAAFKKAAWNTVAVSPVNIAAGSKYWFVLLGTGGLMKFRQKAIAGGWIDELNSIRDPDFPAGHMGHRDNLFGGRLDIGVRVGSDQRSTGGNFHLVGESGRLQLDCQGWDNHPRAGQREYHKHRDRACLLFQA